MSSNPPPQAVPKDSPASPDNPGLAATGEFPHGAQQEGAGAGVTKSETKAKPKAGRAGKA